MLVLLVAPLTASAKELDQFTDRLSVLQYYAGGYRDIPGAPGPKQVDSVLDGKMNALLDELAESLAKRAAPSVEDRDALVRDVFQHRFFAELINPYEEWVKHEAPVPLYRVVNKGIYGRTIDYDDMRMTWYIEASPIIQVAGVLIGLDKLGHFIAQGWQYYGYSRRLPAAWSERARYQALRRFADHQEREQLGLATGGVYSFADLASNWQGMLFFMALFRDIEVEGERHTRYFELDATGHYRRIKQFHWSEWVTSDWDEALNPSLAESPVLIDKLRENFAWRSGGQPSICDEYRRSPEAFLGPARRLRPRESYTVSRAPTGYPIDARSLCTP